MRSRVLGGVAGSHTSPRIEATRGLAALAVLAYHLQVVTHGYNGSWPALTPGARVLMFGQFGVAVFFALSGYLLFRPWLRTVITAQRIDIKRYALNRVLRILPLYYAAVVLLLLVQPSPLSWDQMWHHLVFAQYLTPDVRPVDGPLWSLICEVEFYALLPLLGAALLSIARGSSARAVWSVTGFAVAAWALSRAALTQTPYPVWNFSLAANLVYFAPGMLVAAVEVHSRHTAIRVPHARSIAVGLSVGAAGCWALLLPWPTRDEVLLAAAATLAAVVACNHAFPVQRRRFAAMAALGLCSYSLYVWHLPIVSALAGAGILNGWLPHDAAIAVPLCVLAAALSYALIEAPFLRLRRRWTAEALRVGLGASATPVPPRQSPQPRALG